MNGYHYRIQQLRDGVWHFMTALNTLEDCRECAEAWALIPNSYPHRIVEHIHDEVYDEVPDSQVIAGSCLGG